MYGKKNRRNRSRLTAGYHAEPLESRVLLAANVVINELMYHAASQNPADEWLELYNSGDQPADLSGWSFAKGLSFTFAPGTTLAAGGYLVVAHDLARFQSTHPGVGNVVGPWQGSLGNNGDDVELDDAAGASQDKLTYGSEGDWAVRRQGPLDHNHTGWIWTTPADGGGKSMELMDPALGNDSGQNWAPSVSNGGTPGAPNSVATPDAAPEILDLQNLPLIPKSTDPVTITAKIVDEQPSGQTVAVHWRVDKTTAWNVAPMADDGAHNDGAAGDGVWGAILPPQPNNTVVELYVSAADSTGHARTWPAPTDTAGTQGANVLYQVDDTTYTGNQSMFKLIMTDAQRAELALIGSNANDGLSNAQMNGTFISIDGGGADVRYTIGIRNRGGGTRHLPPNNYRININNDDRWHGLRALDVNGQYSMEDIAGAAVIHAAGLAGQQAVPVQVRVNNANLASAGQYDMFGTYSWVEAENSDLVADQFPADPNGNYYRGTSPSHSATLAYLGATPSLYYDSYPKQTNSEVNDYSDLINLLKALDPTQTPDAQYVQAVSQAADVTEWMRYFAVSSLMGNQETALSTGYGDDFSMYRGLVDAHFQLLPHDLDTVLGRGDTTPVISESLFQAAALPVVARFLENPTFVPIYYLQLRELAQTTFSAGTIGPVLDNTLKGYVPQAVIDTMKTFTAQRVAYVLSQIPQGVSATTTLAASGGYPYTTGATAPLSGKADPTTTRSVLVDGVPATWTPWQASWTAPAVPLHAGINRILVQAMDAGGNELAHTYLDVWQGPTATSTVSGTLATGLTHWTLAGSPYHVTGTVTVPAGGVLQIDPGVTVFFDAGTSLSVDGQIVAQGTAAQRIVFAKTPTAASAWDRVLVQNTQTGSSLAYVTMEGAGSGSENVQVLNARLDMDHLEWLNTNTHILDFVNASFRLTNSIVPSVTSGVEPAHYVNDYATNPPGAYAIVQGNVFGTTSGYNDVFDFTGGIRPGAIVQFLGNTFLGNAPAGVAGDDILDLDGTDAHIEGNVFLNVGQLAAGDTNSAISGGNYTYPQGGTVSSHVVSVRNFFYNVDRGILMKQGNTFQSINDTFVHVLTAPFNFSESGTAAGAWGYADGDIFYDVPMVNGVPRIVLNPPTGTFIMEHSIVPGPYPGAGNIVADPELVNTTNVTDPRVDFQLKPTSPARGTGPNGRDMGAAVPAGASVAGEPPAQTDSTSATLTVGGPDIYAYKYRVNNGAWSNEIDTISPGTQNPTIPPIQLSGLAPGTYTVYIVEKNDAGVWQDTAQPTVSKTWTVDPSHSQLRINEVLALNNTAVNHEGTFPDVVELYDDGATQIDLSGMSISDKAGNPQLFVFPQGTTIDAHGYLVLYANNPDGTSGIHLGFALNGGGEDLTLYNASGSVIDQVSFGQQIPDLSIGRMPDGSWTLTRPTPGAANVALPMGDASKLKINEWLANGLPPFGDFVELYNTDPLPVPMGGLYLTDQPVTWPDRDQIHPLSFIPAHGFMAFRATGDNTPAPDEVNFRLNHDEGMIGLFDSGKRLIDQVIYGSQTAGVSQGRSPDGGPEYSFFPQPSPGVPNPAPLPSQTTNYTLTSYTDAWHYYQSGAAPAGWQAAGTNFADGWAQGGGLLYVETSALPAPKTTPLTLGQTTYYFRRHFTLPVDPSQLATFQLSTIVDDGAIVYINGIEVFRIGMPTGAVSYSTFANRTVDNAVIEGPFNLPTSELVRGDNVITVEVHQAATTSSDIVWGGMLTATANVAPDTTVPPLRITEINYNPAAPPAGSPYTSQDFEFIELQNTGQQAISLAGVGFTAGVSFVFSNGTLNPGQYVLVVKNQAAFESRYGAGFNIAGQYTGNLDDAGEEIRLQTASGESILDFAYAGSWYPTTDGGGHTLVIRDALADPSTWNKPASWRASTAPGGSPEADDPAPPQVVGRWVFYNNSRYDGNTPGVDSRDDAAIASDKSALVAGHTATFENYTSYSRGINGIMIDVDHLPSGAAISAADFLFKVGNNANVANWLDAPAPSSVTVRHNAGGNGIDRIEIIWPDGAIRNTWLQVTLKADDTTLLAAPDVFYFGNAVGESGNSTTDGLVTSADELAARNDPHSFMTPATITNAHDYNRDGRVDAIDQIIARNNATTTATALNLITAPGPTGGATGTLTAAAPKSVLQAVRKITAAPKVAAATAAAPVCSTDSSSILKSRKKK